MKSTLSIVALVCMLFSACSPKLNSSSPLYSGAWVLLEMNGVPVQVSGTDKDAQLRFEYAGRKVTGSGGCNNINGTYEANTTEIAFKNLASTKMYCVDQRFEDKFLENVRNVAKYSFAGDNLVLKDKKDNTLLVLKKRN